MSRAKDPKIVQESQKVFKVIRIIAGIIAVVLIIFVAYPIITKKDPDVAKLRKIQQEQVEKAMKRELAPYQKRVAELEKESKRRILTREEMEELKCLLARVQEAKKKHTISTDTANKAYEYEYKLSAGQKIYTQVKVEPKAIYGLWANQPFEVIGRQYENGSIEDYPYIMPADESGWQWLGDDPDEPGGVFVLQGITNDTLVKISRVKK